VLYAPGTDADSSQFSTGMLRDLSDAGACLYVQERFGRGEMLRLTASSCGLSRLSEVMWSQKVDDGLYKTGVRFVKGR
jgi:hypothetical protein